jgi:hypothetical protein
VVQLGVESNFHRKEPTVPDRLDQRISQRAADKAARAAALAALSPEDVETAAAFARSFPDAYRAIIVAYDVSCGRVPPASLSLKEAENAS